MLFNQITALEEISAELQKVNSLLTLLGDYFGRTDLDAVLLQNRYQTYSDLAIVAHDIVHAQQKRIDDASGKLNTIRKELKRHNELI